MAGVGLLSVPLPAAAVATSGSSGGGEPVLQSGSGWSLTGVFTVKPSSLGATYTEASIFVANSTQTNGTAVVRFYYLNSGSYEYIGEAASVTVFATDDNVALVNNMSFTFVEGTYAARLFLNGSTTTYVDVTSASFGLT